MKTTTRKLEPHYFAIRELDDDATTEVMCAAIIKGTEAYVRIALETTQVRMTPHQADAFLSELFTKIVVIANDAVMHN